MAYKHTQVGTVILIMASAVVIFLFYINKQENRMFVWLTTAFLSMLLILFGTLTVEITDTELSCRFGPGLIHKEFPLDEITGATVVTNPWYYGWGIRWTPHGLMYNVSGLQAVELSLASGEKFRIGSDQPEELADAIQTAIDDRNYLPVKDKTTNQSN